MRPSKLRYYEGIGMLPSPERANGRRRYDAEVVREVLDRLCLLLCSLRPSTGEQGAGKEPLRTIQ